MKVIDLLNKIANGEEVPNQITIRNDTLVYNKNYSLYLQDYYYIDDEEDATWKIWAYELNDEVEIIEEDKKLEKDKNLEKLDEKLTIDDLDCPIRYNEMKIWKQVIKEHNKINEIIDKINKKER